jgi:putative FmdB family regulatory protein
MSYHLAVAALECQRAEEGPVPTYQYACTACDERLEVVQRFTDDPLTECSACGGRLRKVFSPVGIVFKGSGFYRTDSRNGSRADGKEKQPAGAGEGGSCEKPAAEKAGDAAKPAAGKPGDTAKPAKKAESTGKGSKPAPAKVA